MATKLEWKATLGRHGHKCSVCKITEKRSGSLKKPILRLALKVVLSYYLCVQTVTRDLI